MLNLPARIFRRRRVVNERDLAYERKYTLLADSTNQADSTYSRLIGYIPADAVALYVMGVGVLGGQIVKAPETELVALDAMHLQHLQWLFLVVLVLAPLLAAVGTLRQAPVWWLRVQMFQVITAPIAFSAVETHCESPKNCNAEEGASRSPAVLRSMRG
jgi:hypothetical protein